MATFFFDENQTLFISIKYLGICVTITNKHPTDVFNDAIDQATLQLKDKLN